MVIVEKEKLNRLDHEVPSKPYSSLNRILRAATCYYCRVRMIALPKVEKIEWA